MIVVGEKINTSRKEASEAVAARDAAHLREMARRQMDAGATYVDVNCGTFSEDEAELLPWMVREIQDELGGAPVCIDSNNPEAIATALEVHVGKPLLNVSFSGESSRYEPLSPLIDGRDCRVVAMCMDDEFGFPPEAEQRFKVACDAIERLHSLGVADDDIFIDPLIQPIGVDTRNGLISANTIRLIRTEYPAVHSLCGLSNISHEMPERKLLNQAFMVICAANGLDAVLLNPEDKDIMRLVYAADVLLDRDPYCRNFMKARRKGRLG